MRAVQSQCFHNKQPTAMYARRPINQVV